MQALLIEDDEHIRELVNLILEIKGFQTSQAKDGQEACDIADKHEATPDIIITDIGLPKVDGFGVVKRFRQYPAYEKTPILVLSTRSNKSDIDNAYDSGADGYMIKPFDIEEFTQKISHLIAAGSAR